VVYRTFISDLSRANGWRLPALIALMSVVALTEGVTVTLLLPLLVRVGIAGSNDSPIATAINKLLAVVAPESGGVGPVLAIILLLAMTQMTLFVSQGLWNARLVSRYEAAWRTRLFDSFLKADWLFLTERKAGELTAAVVVEIGRIGGAFQFFTLLASTAITATIYLCLAMLVSWQATLLLMALAAVMVLTIARLYGVSYAAGLQVGPLNAELQVLVSESLASAKIIKASVSEQLMMGRVKRVVRALQRVAQTANFVPSLVRGIFEFMAIGALATFLAFSMAPLRIAPAEMLVVVALFVRLFPRFTNTQTLLHNLSTHAPALLTVRHIFTDATARAERTTGAEAALQVTLPSRLEVRGLHGAIGDKAILNGIDLTFEVPGMVGIVGGSGAGKSTLVHTLLALVPPCAGTIRLGSHDITAVAPTAWRHAFGYVPQETIFFHSSVAENLRLARPDATREEIVEAARRANAHDFVMALPQGYDTPIGDQGVLLSGGQRQRLGIARALVARPVLLLLDEPTSALDPQSEIEILATLEELRRSVGIVIVAHRLTTVRAADQIYVLDRGHVVESGNWSELITRQGRFHDLAKLQQIVV